MMKKLTIPLAIIFFFVGLLIENQYDFIKSLSNDDDTSDEAPKKSRWTDKFQTVQIESPIDGNMQMAYFYKTTSADPQPLVVSLHTWSNDYTQYDSLNDLSAAQNFNYIHPDFRGVNNSKNACCSELVISDIDASIDFALANSNVDTTRIYVIGMSGGGYATLAMFMKSKHRIKKFSSWVPLTDLVKWYDETKIRGLKYSAEILACTESVNGILNEEIAIQKSPIHWETPKEKLQYADLKIFTGVYDGVQGNGIIPITHSINFYNKLLGDLNEVDSANFVSDAEKLFLLENRKAISDFSPIADRDVFLVKESNNIQLTLFEGGHEILTDFAFRELTEEI